MKNRANGRFVQCRQYLAFGIQTFLHFGDPFVKQLGPDDLKIKKAGAGLIADLQQIAETLGDDQQHPLALAFKQGVGRDRGAHFDRANGIVGQIALCADQIANTLHGGVLIAFGVFRQQFMGHQRPIGFAGDHVGESAATVNPEFPFSAHIRLFRPCPYGADCAVMPCVCQG